MKCLSDPPKDICQVRAYMGPVVESSVDLTEVGPDADLTSSNSQENLRRHFRLRGKRAASRVQTISNPWWAQFSENGLQSSDTQNSELLNSDHKGFNTTEEKSHTSFDSDVCMCIAQWDPVCGFDNTTYSNVCFYQCEHGTRSGDFVLGECKDEEGSEPPEDNESILSTTPTPWWCFWCRFRFFNDD